MQHLIYNSKFVFNSLEVDTNSVFIALTTGERDGNYFAQDALKRGAKFLILSQHPSFEIPPERFIVVNNTLEFITDLAKKKFLKFKQDGVKTISLTGSIGKTTTKDFIIFLLTQAGKKVYGTVGNFNNHIGVPITILNAPEKIDFLILEMGMNHKGELNYLNEIANSDIKIITDISSAHIGNFKDGIKGIAKSKAEILKSSNEGVIFITKKDLLFLEEVTLNFKGKLKFIPDVLNYKVEDGQTLFTVNEKSYFLNTIKTSDWLKSLAFGFAVCDACNIKYPLDISSFQLSGGRGVEVKLKNGCVVIDESYNASTSSVINALQNLMLLNGKGLAVLGEMKEMGREATEEHQKIVNFLIANKIEAALVGEEFLKCTGISIYPFFKTVQDLITNYKMQTKYDYILVKASNSVKLNLFIEALKRF